jgi:hypothetical protein
VDVVCWDIGLWCLLNKGLVEVELMAASNAKLEREVAYMAVVAMRRRTSAGGMMVDSNGLGRAEPMGVVFRPGWTYNV